jgi:anti-sigma factor (TIGR02949 family)
MKCEDIEALVGALLDGELSPSEAERARRHVETCARCGRRAKLVAALKKAVRRAPAPAAPPELKAVLLAQARAIRARRAEPRSAPWRSVWLRPSGIGAAAALAFAAAAVVVLARRPQQVVPIDWMLAAHDEYALTMPLSPAAQLSPRLAERLAEAGD